MFNNTKLLEHVEKIKLTRRIVRSFINSLHIVSFFLLLFKLFLTKMGHFWFIIQRSLINVGVKYITRIFFFKCRGQPSLLIYFILTSVI